jgi:hypothetical protein
LGKEESFAEEFGGLTAGGDCLGVVAPSPQLSGTLLCNGVLVAIGPDPATALFRNQSMAVIKAEKYLAERSHGRGDRAAEILVPPIEVLYKLAAIPGPEIESGTRNHGVASALWFPKFV